MWLPNEVEPGMYSDGANKSIQIICDLTEAYIEKNIDKVYFSSLIDDKAGWLGLTVEDTEKSDEAMSAGFALVAARAKKYIKRDEFSKNIESILPYQKAI